MKDCVFCAIIEGRSGAHLVLDEEEVVAFLDVRPVFPGHVLIVPRAHWESLTDLPSASVPALFAAAQRMAAAVVEGLDADGSFVAVNNRVSQSVPHLHVHVVPRRFKDGLRGFFWPRRRYADEEEMSRTAESIRSRLSAP